MSATPAPSAPAVSRLTSRWLRSAAAPVFGRASTSEVEPLGGVTVGASCGGDGVSVTAGGLVPDSGVSVAVGGRGVAVSVGRGVAVGGGVTWAGGVASVGGVAVGTVCGVALADGGGVAAPGGVTLAGGAVGDASAGAVA